MSSDFYVRSYAARRSAGGLLLTAERVAMLDLEDAIRRRRASFRFDLVNAVSGINLGTVEPIEDQPAMITHDTSRTIKRDLKLMLDPSDAAEINVITDRISPYMILDGRAWPLGRFMFTSRINAVNTGGNDASVSLMDEGWLIDQELTAGFSSTKACDLAVEALLKGLPLQGLSIAPSPYPCVGAWQGGVRRGQVIDAIAVMGDYQTPWMNNAGNFEMVRTIDASIDLPAIDWDANRLPLADSIQRTDNQIDSPNRFMVIGNGTASNATAIVGTFDIPPNAPHSIANRGFVVQATTQLGVQTTAQATAAARNIGMRATVVEQLDLTTPPDPRHDGYTIVRWDGLNWLEVAWSLEMIEGGDMTHTLLRSFAAV